MLAGHTNQVARCPSIQQKPFTSQVSNGSGTPEVKKEGTMSFRSDTVTYQIEPLVTHGASSKCTRSMGLFLKLKEMRGATILADISVPSTFVVTVFLGNVANFLAVLTDFLTIVNNLTPNCSARSRRTDLTTIQQHLKRCCQLLNISGSDIQGRLADIPGRTRVFSQHVHKDNKRRR